jgi:hypothetical protein
MNDLWNNRTHMMARWIRLGPVEQHVFDGAYAALALAQARSAPPILLWAEEAARYPFALIAPLKFAPGRRERWFSWALASAVATYRQFGVPAYLDNELYLHGRNIADSSVSAGFPGRSLPLSPRIGSSASRPISTMSSICMAATSPTAA